MGQTAQFSFTIPQQAIYNSKARFKVVVAGRRLGKTTFACMTCIIEALKQENDMGILLDSSSEVVYFGVDREQAKRNAWNMLKEFARPFTTHIRENDFVLTVNNGVNDCRIRLMGMDRPDTARGMKLRYAVLDEYADMPPDAWGEIIRPALMDVRGSALFIGTPKGKNHFYELYGSALTGESGKSWEAFNFQSKDNETIHEDELIEMVEEYSRGSPELYAQEIEGKFISKGGALFHTDDFIIDPEEPKAGSYFITVDLAGFSRESTKKNARISRLDESSICINKAFPSVDKDGKADTGWWIKEIRHGRWDVEETANQIVDAYVQTKASAIGIEKGALLNAVAPYLDTIMRQRNVWMTVKPLSHGNQRKYDRIQWSLQGRVKRGLIRLNKGDWNEALLEQAVDFPSKLTHDDLLDSLAYQDQIADWYAYDLDMKQQQWEPVDIISGY
jgi:phage terminase large subunit-like protein